MKAVAGEDRKQLQTTLSGRTACVAAAAVQTTTTPRPGRAGTSLKNNAGARCTKEVKKGGFMRKRSSTRALGSCCVGQEGPAGRRTNRMGWWLQGEWGLGTSWSPASGTHAGQEDGGPQDALSICGATLRRGFFCSCHGGGSEGEAFSSCSLQDSPAPPDSWFPLGS